MSFSPNLFLSNIRGKDGLAKNARFEVILPIPPYINQFIGNSIIEKILNFPNSIFNDVSDAIGSVFGRGGQQDEYSRTSNASVSRYLALQCEAAELPGKSLSTADVKIYGPAFKVPYQTIYGDISFTFLCTNDFYERKLFDKWIECIMPPDTNNLRYPKGENTRYLSDITIMQFDEFIKQIYAIKLIDAFPVTISSMPLSWSDDNFHRVTVSFAYHYHKIIYDGKYDIGQAIGSTLGSIFSDFTRQFQQAILT